jgi:hypothetical protein
MEGQAISRHFALAPVGREALRERVRPALACLEVAVRSRRLGEGSQRGVQAGASHDVPYFDVTKATSKAGCSPDPGALGADQARLPGLSVPEGVVTAELQRAATS